MLTALVGPWGGWLATAAVVVLPAVARTGPLPGPDPEPASLRASGPAPSPEPAPFVPLPPLSLDDAPDWTAATSRADARTAALPAPPLTPAPTVGERRPADPLSLPAPVDATEPEQPEDEDRAHVTCRVDRNVPVHEEVDEEILTDVNVIAGLDAPVTSHWRVGVSLELSERDFQTGLVPDTDRHLRMDESWFLGVWTRCDLIDAVDTRLGLGWSGNDPDRPIRPEYGLAEPYREFVVTLAATLRF